MAAGIGLLPTLLILAAICAQTSFAEKPGALSMRFLKRRASSTTTTGLTITRSGKRLDSIESALSTASNASKDVFMVYTNLGFVSFTQNVICSAKRQGLTNLLVAATDAGVCDHFPDVTCVFDSNLAGEQNAASKVSYGSNAYYGLMQIKMKLVAAVVRSGYNLMLSDNDVVLLKNPYDHLPKDAEDVDLFMQNDRCGSQLADAAMCAGFFYLRSNERSIRYIDAVNQKMNKNLHKFSEDNDQVLMNQVAKTMGLKVSALPCSKFTNGFNFYVSGAHSKEWFSDLVMVHSNWVRGYNSKMACMQHAKLWFLGEQGECAAASEQELSMSWSAIKRVDIPEGISRCEAAN